MAIGNRFIESNAPSRRGRLCSSMSKAKTCESEHVMIRIALQDVQPDVGHLLQNADVVNTPYTKYFSSIAYRLHFNNLHNGPWLSEEAKNKKRSIGRGSYAQI